MNFAVADELEAILAIANTNTQPALRGMINMFEARERPNQPEEKVKRREREKERRVNWRCHLERIRLLFRSEKFWSKKDLLGLGETIFPMDRRD